MIRVGKGCLYIWLLIIDTELEQMSSELTSISPNNIGYLFNCIADKMELELQLYKGFILTCLSILLLEIKLNKHLHILQKC